MELVIIDINVNRSVNLSAKKISGNLDHFVAHTCKIQVPPAAFHGKDLGMRPLTRIESLYCSMIGGPMNPLLQNLRFGTSVQVKLVMPHPRSVQM